MYNPRLRFHFIGIGGSGMSGIAEILLKLGFQVSGSDLVLGPVTDRLQALGAEVFEGHSPSHVPEETSSVVYSSAVVPTNVEVLEAQRRALPVVSRAEVLAELMRLKYGVAVAGSHGKTTTTSLIACVIEAGQLDPTVIIGGRVKAIGSGSKLGKGDYLVAETDESDRSFLLLKPTIAVVTNIDSEHLTAYDSFEHLKECFSQFVHAVPFYGLAVLCVDDPHVREFAQGYERRCVTYGFSADADIRAEAIEQQKNHTSYDLSVRGESLGRITLAMPGRHSVSNSMAAVAVALEFGIDIEIVREALCSFAGVERRSEILAETAGVTVINDYGHHPTEIRTTLQAIREGWKEQPGSLRVVFQPHRYSRVRDCFDRFVNAFSDCDELFVTDIYSAGEEPIEGISGEILSQRIDHPHVSYVRELHDFPERIAAQLHSGDVVVCLGAGSIGNIGREIANCLTQSQ